MFDINFAWKKLKKVFVSWKKKKILPLLIFSSKFHMHRQRLIIKQILKVSKTIYSCIPHLSITLVYLCYPLCALVYPCRPYTSIHPRIPKHTPVYLYIPLYTYINPRIPLYTLRVYLYKPLYTSVYPCIPIHPLGHPCIPLYTLY